MSGVEWTPAFVAFLYYFFVVVTYWLPGADVAIVVALIALLLRPDQWRMCPFLYLFAGFAGWCLLSYLGSSHQSESWEQTNTVLKMWLIAFAAYNVVRTRAQLRFFLAFAIACFVLFPARGAFVNYFGGYNVLGRALWNFAYANPNDLAAYALLFATMAAAFFFIARNRMLKLGALGAVGILLLLIFFTQSRGALLAAGVVALMVVFANRKNPRVLMGAAAMLVGAIIVAPKGAFDRLAGLATASFSTGFQGVDQERSAEQRYQLLQVSVAVAKDNMAFGVGPGVYHIVHGAYARAAAGTLPLAAGNRDPHNTVMRTAAETGVVGLTLFLAMIVMAWARAFKALRRTRRAGGDPVIRFLSFGLIAFMIAGLFGSFTYLNVLYLQLAMLEVAIALSRQPSVPAPARARPGRRFSGPLPRPAIRPGT